MLRSTTFGASSLRGILVAMVLMLVLRSVEAQTITCKTSNCTAGNPGAPVLPAECRTPAGTIASPRIITVRMNGANFRFEPADPRIEGRHTTPGLAWDYQCIIWQKVGSSPWHSATEATAGNTCRDEDPCTNTNTHPDPCAFETGNIDVANWEFGTCHYQQVPPASYPYKCRLHDTFGMVGTLTVVPPIDLRVTKGAGGEVILQWPTGGSAAGPWDLFRATTAAMTAPTRLSPPAGTSSRTLNDAAPLAGLVYYMVRECNLLAGSCL